MFVAWSPLGLLAFCLEHMQHILFWFLLMSLEFSYLGKLLVGALVEVEVRLVGSGILGDSM